MNYITKVQKHGFELKVLKIGRHKYIKIIHEPTGSLFISYASAVSCYSSKIANHTLTLKDIL